MKVGLLQCDDVNELLLPAHGNYPEMFELALRKRLPQMHYRVYQAHRGELPADVHECDVYLTTGSKHGVYEDYDWIRELEGFVRSLWAEEKPLVGVCFGHQLMARAMGGHVQKSERGWGVAESERPDWQVNDAYKGPAYAVAQPELWPVIADVARTEGLFLDPVYTGKAMLGLLSEVRAGRLGGRILFWHTGGAFGLFGRGIECPS